MEKKIVIAKIRILKGTESEYMALVPPLIEATKAEPGNLAYTLYQSTEDATEFLVYEEYINEEAFNVHCNSEHFQSFAQQVKPMLAGDLDIKTF
jgi:quinol monooxygenase YgiN